MPAEKYEWFYEQVPGRIVTMRDASWKDGFDLIITAYERELPASLEYGLADGFAHRSEPLLRTTAILGHP